MKNKIVGLFVAVGLLTGLHFLMPAHQPGSQPGSAASPGNAASPKNTVKASQSAAVGSRRQSAAASTSEVASIPQASNPIKKADKYVTIDNQQYPLRSYKTLMVPNDPQAAQWWVGNAHLDQSWDIPAGSHQTTLAVIDTGFDLKHEEFANRWYVNSGESGATTQEAASALNCTDRGLPVAAGCNLIDDDRDGIVDNESGPATYQNPSRKNCTDQGKARDKSCNRIDDDDNGYIDDVTGWDFMNNDNSPQAGELNPTGSGTQHGTWTAGVAAASGNNGKGIAGVDWSTKILPIQALNDDDTGDTLSVGRSIYYAINRGADVISISLGSDLPDDYVRQAVQAALKQGIVVVAAAGNDGCDCMVYPANYPEVVGVGALNSSNQPASFSSYGQNLDIMAPGTNLTAPNYSAANQISSYAGGLNGTSFATPIIGGMLTRLKSWQPSATPEQLIAALTENVNRLSLPSGTPHDTHYGFGTLDALRTSARMTTPKTSFNYVFSPVSSGAALNASSPAEPGGNAFVYACENGIVGSTAVMEEIRGASQFFTISQAENQQAVDAGYSSGVFTYACVRQPHDAATVMRNLNIFKEFRNDYQKLP
jgi:hypothetical protein